MNWLIVLSAILLSGAAVVTLRAAEQATARGGQASPNTASALAAGNGGTATTGASANSATQPGSAKQHPPASAPEESATIKDDPTTAPDPAQSADNDVSFPTDT